MTYFLILLFIATAGATVFFLIRGIVAFLKTSEQELLNDGVAPSARRQNKAMQGRIIMQALAVGLALLALIATGARG